MKIVPRFAKFIPELVGLDSINNLRRWLVAQTLDGFVAKVFWGKFQIFVKLRVSPNYLPSNLTDVLT